MPLSLLRLVGLLGTVAVATLQTGYFSVSSASICTLQNALIPPPGLPAAQLYVDRIAWQLGGPPLTRPLIVNGVGPASEPELLCVTGGPASACAPPDLWWAARYDNLTLSPAAPATLPDITGQMPPLPPVLMVLYETSVTVQSPSPRRTTAQTPAPLAAPVASVVACPEPNPHATPAAISLGVLLIVSSVMLATCWRMNRSAECPYCLGAVTKGRLRGHLDECKQHLERFTPVVLERVRVIHQTVTHLEAGNDDEKEDLVARPEPAMGGQ